jgi:hypothetical protein
VELHLPGRLREADKAASGTHQTTADVDQAAVDRELAAYPVIASAEQAQHRDEVARRRDRVAAERDRAAVEAHDRQLDDIAYQLWGPDPRVQDAVEALAGLRAKAAAQRLMAAADRERAARDREAATADREQLLAELDEARRERTSTHSNGAQPRHCR